MKRNASALALMESLMKLNSELLDRDEPFDICPSYFTAICRLMDSLTRRGDQILVLQANHLSWYKQCIKFVTLLIAGIEKVFPQEAILYCINNILHVRTQIDSDCPLSGIIDDSVFTLHRYLKPKYQKIFLNNLVVGLSELLSYNNAISLNANCDEISLKSDDGCEQNLYRLKTRKFNVPVRRGDEFIRWILRFLLHNLNALDATLSPINLYRVWLAALKIIARNADDVALNSCFRIVSRLLMRNCYEPTFVIILIDLLLCREQQYLANYSLQSTSNEMASNKLDVTSWTCLKTIVMHLANADFGKLLRIRSMRCTLYLRLLRRTMRLLDANSQLPPARLRRLADFVLNSLLALKVLINEPALHGPLNEFVGDLLKYGRHFFEITFEWKSFAALSSFFQLMIVSRDEDQVMDYIQSLLSVSRSQRGATAMTAEFYNHRWFPCLVCALFCLSVNKDCCFRIVERLSKLKENSLRFSFTETIRERFLGILLEFRRSISEDDIFRRCRQRNICIIQSLGVLMTNLGNEFFNQISSKLLVVLKATSIEREACIPIWEIFLRKLSHSQMLVLMPQILVAIVPLLSCPATKTLLNHIFFEREAELVNISSDKLFNILLVMSNNDYTKLLDEYIPAKLKEEPTSVVLESCISMLLSEGVETYQMILTRILGFVNSTEVGLKITSRLNRALLYALRRTNQSDVRDLIARCLGSIGAIDPDKSTVEQATFKGYRLAYVDDRGEFYKLFLERIVGWYADCTDSEAVDQLCNSILANVAAIRKTDLGNEVWDNLDVSVRREMEPLKSNPLLPISQPFVDFNYALPIIQKVKSLEKWIRNLYCYLAKEIFDKPMQKLFLSVMPVNENGAISFMSEMLPHILGQLIIEKNTLLIDNFRNEAISVFRLMLNNNAEEWIGLATQTIFSVLDSLEKFSVHRLQKIPPMNDLVYKQVGDLLRSTLNETNNDFDGGGGDANNVGIPLCVLAAEKCNCFFRALRWLEQYGIRYDVTALSSRIGVLSDFRREHFYYLERLYINLDDSDGVLGAYTTIQNNVTPTPNEQILALEATGNYADALPLCQTIKGQEVALIKCLLRLNQPYLARNNVEHILKNDKNVDRDVNYHATLIDLQMEATCRLGDWNQLKVVQESYYNIGVSATGDSNGNTVAEELKIGVESVAARLQPTIQHSWGAQLASIICSLRQSDCKAFDEQIKLTRNSLINSVLAMTFESVESYTQIHKYIVRLHALREIEEAKKSIFNKDRASIDLFVEKWESKSESSNSINLLEPILAVRRELLRVIDTPGTKDATCRLLLQSARLSRRAGHLQTAWTFLCEARATQVQSIEIDMETSRYFFQKKEQTQAINILQKAIETNFPEMAGEFLRALRNGKINEINRGLFTDFTKRKPFVQAYLLLAEFLEKASANRLDALLGIYQSLEQCGEESEAFLYHYAVFFDRYCESMKEVDDEMIFNLIKLYGSVLRQGAKYLQHVMPRMLTVWLDWNPQFQRPLDSGIKLGRGMAQRKSNSYDINSTMKDIFNELNPYYFYTCFSQLISRITHSNVAVFKTLKQILSELIVAFPHQCLWRSIAISRSSQSKIRRDRCLEVYDLAKKRCTNVDLNLLISQYTFLAESFIHIAEDGNKRAASKFSDMFPFVTRFFADGTMARDGMNARGVGGKKGVGRAASKTSLGGGTSAGAPQIVLPFIDEVVEHNTNASHASTTSFVSHNNTAPTRFGGNNFDPMACFSQIELVDSRHQKAAATDLVYRFREIYIKAVADDYDVLQSMATPKRMTLIGSDGKRYPLLCKAGDELRKDARFMDVSRMLNSLFQRDVEARRRRLFVRCYGVIPLQETGGIIEWVPNLITMAGAIRPLIRERTKMIPVPEMQRVGDPRLPDEERLKNFRDILCARTPLVLAEWFRRKFQDAGCWYNARVAFTRTCATMSIIGFIFGLGDRHAENILIDSTTGELMHVDFNILFNKGEFLRVPEIVPFRLTRNMIDAFGATGVEGAFRRSSETVMRVIRNDQSMLVTVLQAFVHDPLMEWTVAESRNQQSKQFGGSALQNASTPECQEAHDTLEMIRLRLAGNIVTARFQKRKDSFEMSVEGQVAKLIEMAVDEASLSKMYIGWNAFL